MFLVRKSKARLAYERRTKTLIDSFKARQLSFQECTRELDAAFEGFLVRSKDEPPALRTLALDNNLAVMQEIVRRPIHLMPKKTTQASARASASRAGRAD